MAWIRRIALFFALNALVILTISFLSRLLHVQPFLQSYGISYKDLLIFCSIWGFAGAFISLALSRLMAKWMLRVQVIDASTADPQSRKLLNTVYQLSRAAHLPEMPQVGIYESAEVNAFATGPTRHRSLVAVSRGLLNRLSEQEIEGVIGHEIAHIVNGDMVTMTLVQGVINAFVMFMARALAFALSGLGNQNSRQRSSLSSHGTYQLLVFVFEIVFMLLGMVVIAGYSRFREFRADRGGAHLAGRGQMIAALEALKRVQTIVDPKADRPSLEAMKISSPKKQGIKHLFATHPPLETRIERLKQSI